MQRSLHVFLNPTVPRIHILLSCWNHQLGTLLRGVTFYQMDEARLVCLFGLRDGVNQTTHILLSQIPAEEIDDCKARLLPLQNHLSSFRREDDIRIVATTELIGDRCSSHRTISRPGSAKTLNSCKIWSIYQLISSPRTVAPSSP
jgi:hypothetical protein